MKYAWVHNESQSKNGWTPLRLLSNRNMSIHTKSRGQFAEVKLQFLTSPIIRRFITCVLFKVVCLSRQN
ncbi:Uncharacterized protein APZ42_027132 [Daphnia magna]|uniref:Uncharacterized protein n=1 Tax=Daphnia magna TaxID=35525 RepID=A0A164RAP4_9CRUS|nr:Uncharacterized protein APZ42_027132 [Daphnia magna]